MVHSTVRVELSGWNHLKSQSNVLCLDWDPVPQLAEGFRAADLRRRGTARYTPSQSPFERAFSALTAQINTTIKHAQFAAQN
jgi:hypothetical protein